MYTIRTCIKCGKNLHIRPKGTLFQVKNKCPHVTCELISIDLLNEMTRPLNQVPQLPNITIKPYLCVKHSASLEFRRELSRFTDMYYCPECKKVDKMLPQEHVKWWKKRTHNNNWKTGDVKLTVSPSYDEFVKSGQIKEND